MKRIIVLLAVLVILLPCAGVCQEAIDLEDVRETYWAFVEMVEWWNARVESGRAGGTETFISLRERDSRGIEFDEMTQDPERMRILSGIMSPGNDPRIDSGLGVMEGLEGRIAYVIFLDPDGFSGFIWLDPPLKIEKQENVKVFDRGNGTHTAYIEEEIDLIIRGEKIRIKGFWIPLDFMDSG